MTTTLYVVATPIGHLDDFTHRAIKVLTDCTIWVCEDLSSAKRLLAILNLKDKTLHKYNSSIEAESPQQLESRLLDWSQKGLKDLAMIAEAGTPGIADPGFRLVEAAFNLGWKVSPIPGASTLTALASVAGFPLLNLNFVGFLPKTDKAICNLIEDWQSAPYLFFVSPHRVKQTLKLLAQYFPQEKITMGREITKIHESIVSMTVAELSEKIQTEQARGEYAFVLNLSKVQKTNVDKFDVIDEILSCLNKGMSVKETQKNLISHKPESLNPSQFYHLIQVIRDDKIFFK